MVSWGAVSRVEPLYEPQVSNVDADGGGVAGAALDRHAARLRAPSGQVPTLGVRRGSCLRVSGRGGDLRVAVGGGRPATQARARHQRGGRRGWSSTCRETLRREPVSVSSPPPHLRRSCSELLRGKGSTRCSENKGWLRCHSSATGIWREGSCLSPSVFVPVDSEATGYQLFLRSGMEVVASRFFSPFSSADASRRSPYSWATGRL